MKITVYEAFLIAQKSLPLNSELTFFNDEESNLRLVRAIVKGMKSDGLAGTYLQNLGIVRSFDEAKKLIEKAMACIDKKKKV